jgi:hypothetical protein
LERGKEETMGKILPAVLLAAFLLAACAVRSGYHGEAVIVPALPTVVILEDDPYYVHGGYHYHYQNNVWFYSNSRSGPWRELQRDRWPKETKFKRRGDHKDRDDDRGKGEKRGHEEHDRRY